MFIVFEEGHFFGDYECHWDWGKPIGVFSTLEAAKNAANDYCQAYIDYEREQDDAEFIIERLHRDGYRLGLEAFQHNRGSHNVEWRIIECKLDEAL